MSAPNISELTSVLGKTATQTCTTSNTNMVVNSSGSNTVYKVNTILACNYNTVDVDLSVNFSNNGSSYAFVSSLNVPAKSTIDILQSGKIYLEENDAIQIYASSTNSINVLVSYEIIS